jgi:CRP-like cAMP-binding protein
MDSLGQVFENGEVIIQQGTVGDCLYIIQQGRVEVISEKGESQIKLTELGQGDFFGEMGLFEKDVRSCTIRSVGRTRVMTIDRQNFIQTIQKDPSLAFRLLEMMSNRIRQTNQKIAEMQERATIHG